jgi:pimeloyl-ACP methyl ester carboxylesterase
MLERVAALDPRIASRWMLSEAERAELRDPEVEQLFRALVLAHTPFSSRTPGACIDGDEIKTLRDFPFEEIEAPTLVIHARHDPLVPYWQGLRAAEGIRGAELITLEQGGHVGPLIFRRELVPKLARFLETIDKGQMAA